MRTFKFGVLESIAQIQKGRGKKVPANKNLITTKEVHPSRTQHWLDEKASQLSRPGCCISHYNIYKAQEKPGINTYNELIICYIALEATVHQRHQCNYLQPPFS